MFDLKRNPNSTVPKLEGKTTTHVSFRVYGVDAFGEPTPIWETQTDEADIRKGLSFMRENYPVAHSRRLRQQLLRVLK